MGWIGIWSRKILTGLGVFVLSFLLFVSFLLVLYIIDMIYDTTFHFTSFSFIYDISICTIILSYSWDRDLSYSDIILIQIRVLMDGWYHLSMR